jgi:hypothetical protein
VSEDYTCPACGGSLRHRLVGDEAKVGKYECSDCRAWVDKTPAGYVVVAKVLPMHLKEALAEEEA